MQTRANLSKLRELLAPTVEDRRNLRLLWDRAETDLCKARTDVSWLTRELAPRHVSDALRQALKLHDEQLISAVRCMMLIQRLIEIRSVWTKEKPYG
jgi:hypothetical protein